MRGKADYEIPGRNMLIINMKSLASLRGKAPSKKKDETELVKVLSFVAQLELPRSVLEESRIERSRRFEF